MDNFFCKHFYYITGFCDKKFNFCKFAIFFADSKSRAQELSNEFVICHIWTSNMGFRGGGVKFPAPQLILVFKYPSRDWVKFLASLQHVKQRMLCIFKTFRLLKCNSNYVKKFLNFLKDYHF